MGGFGGESPTAHSLSLQSTSTNQPEAIVFDPKSLTVDQSHKLCGNIDVVNHSSKTT